MSIRSAPTAALRWLKVWIYRNWYPTSPSRLELAEKEILSYYKTPFKIEDVNIGAVVGSEDCKIRTLSMNESSLKTPIVLLHGLGQGVGSWLLNLDVIAAERPVYAIDIPGFGRSSRLAFSKCAQEVEMQIVDCLEAWRKEMKLERMILFGFSWGGFLATAYAFQYPKRLSHLILTEPWGFPKKPTVIKFSDVRAPYPVPPIIAFVLYYVLVRPFNPCVTVRISGMLHCGNKTLRCTYPIVKYFSRLGDEGVNRMVEYLFHCNSQHPTGEMSIMSASSTAGPLWAKFPMSERISTSLDKEVPLTLIYGTKSWLPKMPVSDIQKMRPTSYVNELGGCHDCNASESSTFNEILIKACEFGDQNFKR